MKGKREQDESGAKEITPADTIGPVSAKHVMKKLGAFVTSLVVAFIVYAVYGNLIIWFDRDVRSIGMSLLWISILLQFGLTIATALLTYRALNKKIGQSK